MRRQTSGRLQTRSAITFLNAFALNLRRQAISGVGWSGAATVSRTGLQLLVFIILARILSPSEFGLMGMLIVFVNFAALFSELGFASALVQRKEIEERHRSSIFWLNIMIGIGLTVIIVSSAPLIAGFYREPALVSIAMVVAINFTTGSFKVVQTALLQRDMRFKRLALINITSVTISGVISIAMAIQGFGVWSLVAQLLVQTGVEALIMFFLSDWRPRILFDVWAIRELLAFSANLTGFRVFNYWVRNADNLLVGRFVGTYELGLYSQAYNLLLLPRQLTTVFSTVMFPLFSRIQDDQQRIKKILLRTHRVIAFITVPLMSGLMMVATPFVMTVFGEKWSGMIPLLQAFCLVAVKQPVSTMSWVFQSQGRTDLQFRWAVFSGVVTITFFVVGVRWGVTGVAVAYVLRSYLLWYHAVSIPGKLIGLKFGEYIRNLSGVLVIALVMVLSVWAVGLLMPLNWPSPVVLGTQVTVGVLVYTSLVAGLKITAYGELVELIGQIRAQR
jgi:O-antigen/teichoic acid export membrane protein